MEYVNDKFIPAMSASIIDIPGGGGVLDLNLYGDVPTKKKNFTLLQNFCLQMIPCSRKNR